MAQIKIYGRRDRLSGRRTRISEVLHTCLMETLQLPETKKFHRFLALEEEDFLFPADRSPDYLILEISMFEGRRPETKKSLIREIYRRFAEELAIAPADLEIHIQESPRCNWGIRGLPADELDLNYKVQV